MDEARLTALTAALVRKLTLSDEDAADGQERLEGYLEDACGELCLYLGVDALPERFDSKVVALAAICYRRDSAEGALPGVASLATTEEQLSQTVSYRSAEDWQRAQEQVLASIARYRRVRVEVRQHGTAVSET